MDPLLLVAFSLLWSAFMVWWWNAANQERLGSVAAQMLLLQESALGVLLFLFLILLNVAGQLTGLDTTILSLAVVAAIAWTYIAQMLLNPSPIEPTLLELPHVIQFTPGLAIFSILWGLLFLFIMIVGDNATLSVMVGCNLLALIALWLLRNRIKTVATSKGIFTGRIGFRWKQVKNYFWANGLNGAEVLIVEIAGRPLPFRFQRVSVGITNRDNLNSLLAQYATVQRPRVDPPGWFSTMSNVAIMIIALLIGGYLGIQPPIRRPMTCDEIFDPALNLIPTTNVTAEDIKQWVIQRYGINEKDVATLDDYPQRLKFGAQWTDANDRSYEAVGDTQSGQLEYVGVNWGDSLQDSPKLPRLGEVLNCIGAPEYYLVEQFQIYADRSYPYQFNLSLWYPSQGFVLMGRQKSETADFKDTSAIEVLYRMRPFNIGDSTIVQRAARFILTEQGVNCLKPWTSLDEVAATCRDSQ